MKYIVMTVGALSLALGACAGSQTSEPAAAAPTEAEAKADKELVAKREAAGYRCETVKITGSRIRQRVCSTKATREYNRKKSKEFLQGFGPGNGTPAQLRSGP
ncbi:MAG: hypothetical protein AAFQ82_02180 [Myxococcota bacterium]